MTSLSVMEWNAKPPLQWEWESAAAPVTSKATENTKIWPSIDWGMDVDEQIASGSLISYQGDCGSGVSSGGTSFDLGHASMSKSSKSTSMSSSSTEDKKMFKLSVEAAGKVHSEDFIYKKDELSGTSPTFESSVCSGEPLLSLKLGKRAYFEDISDGNNSKTTSALPLIVRSPVISAKRTRSTFQSISATCCQVEGCNLDLSSAKDYHRKHKVCPNHSKSTKVIVNGVERRFCQQCSRFHGLAEFDENKRSCRKRLSDHNARRRRPHPNVAHFNPPSLSTIIYGGGLQHGNPVFGRVAVEQNSKSSGNNITWSNTSSSINFKAAAVKHEGVGGPLAEATRHGNMLLFDSVSRKTTTVTQLSGDASYGLVPLNAATVKIHVGGGSAEETSLISSSQPPPQQDLHRALSLLSTDARDSPRPRSLPVPVSPQGPHLQTDNIATGIVKPWTYGVPQSSPPPALASSAPPELWHAAAEQWPSNSQRVSMNHHHQNAGNGNNFNNGNAFQECLMSEGQHEFGFDLMMHFN